MENSEPKYGTWVQDCQFNTRRSISNKEIKFSHNTKKFPVKVYDKYGKLQKEIKNPAFIGE
jgi:hypothetical protein